MRQLSLAECFDLLYSQEYPAGQSGSAEEAKAVDVKKDEEGSINVIYLIVCIIGLIGNITVITLIFTRKELKKGITIWYVLQLAIADTIFLATTPFQIIEDVNGHWTLGEWLCKTKQSIMFINYYSSIAFLTIMAIDRYIAVCHGFSGRLQKLRTRKAAYVITAVTWIACVLIAIPSMIHSVVDPPGTRCKLFSRSGNAAEELCKNEGFAQGVKLECCLKITNTDMQTNEDLYNVNVSLGTTVASTPMLTLPAQDHIIESGCSYYEYPHAFKVFIFVNFTVMFLLPFVIISTCYALIMRHLWTKAFNVKGSSSNNTRNRNRVIYMCVALVLIFVTCWSPYHAQNLAKLVGMPGRSSAFCEALLYATSVLLYVNSAINPFIYFFISRLKSHIKSIKSSRAASVMISLFSRHENKDRMSTASTHLNQLEPKKNSAKYSDTRLLTDVDSSSLIVAERYRGEVDGKD